MRVSPVQLKAYFLSRVSVLPREEISIKSQHEVQPFEDWNGVNLMSNVDFGWADGQGDDPRAYVLRLRVRITNESGNKAPYNVDLEATGYLELLGDIPLSDREDIAKVNGASLLFGALREVLLSLTVRSPLGPLVLPGVNFIDLRESIREKRQRSETAARPD